jgi:hypothetical protein
MSSIAINLAELFLIAALIEQDALIHVVPEQRTHFRSVGAGQQIRADVFGADCVSLRLLIILALIIPADCHRKTCKVVAPDQSGYFDDIGVRGLAPIRRTFAYVWKS